MDVKDFNRTENSDYLCAHADVVNELLKKMPPDETLYNLAELFKVFGDSTRIKILYSLFEHELCVGDIALLLGMTQTAVSHQLKILKMNKLVKFRRDGKILFYSLLDDHVHSVINQGMEHICE